MIQARPTEEEIFKIAREIAAPQARTAYLRQACGDDSALYQRLVALLQVAEEEQSFLEHPAVTPETELFRPLTEGPGTTIGPYKLLQQIGEGGMGVVFMAEQQQPVRRRVALKVLKPGMDTRHVIARFEAERQALALMDHPNIARVLDAGETASGRPYFVMELVKGVPITQFCDEGQLTPRQRLELFLPVCQAIQHAHQKGIIHRDVKPSNILVAEYDHQAVPKVIDFGVAKATGQELTEKTMFTALGQIVGTLEYMSPEQAKMNQLDIDTRSDIYSLGVLLYELLTGTTPFDKKRLHGAAIDEILRIIREEEPPCPSTRLSTIDTLAKVAASRKTEPGRLTGIVRGELDWIVMKALEKDRNRRYESVSGLGTDIQRYLNDEPVQACPPSVAYRFRKFARRNKAVLATGMIVAASLVVGLIGTTWQSIRATNAERVARQKEAEARESEQQAVTERSKAVAERDAKDRALADEAIQRQRADAERTRADEKARVAQAVNDFMIDDILKANPYWGLNTQPGGQAPTLLSVVERAASQVGTRFKDQPLVEAAVRSAIGCSLLEFEKRDEAAEQLEVSVRLFRQELGDDDDFTSVRALQTFAYVQYVRGRLEESEKLHAEALERANRTLPIEHENRRIAVSHYAHCLSAMGKLQVAESMYLQCIADTLKYAGETPQLQMVRSGLVGLYRRQRRYEESERLNRLALAEHRRLTSDVHPNTVNLIRHLGNLLVELRRFDEAVPLFEEAVAAERLTFGESRPTKLVEMLSELERAYAGAQRWSDAENVVQQTLKVISPSVFSSRDRSGYIGNYLAKAYADAQMPTEAIAVSKNVRDSLAEKLGQEDPRTLRALQSLATTYISTGDRSAGIQLLEQVRDKRIATLGPEHPDTQATLRALTLHSTGQARESAFAEIQRLKRQSNQQSATLGPDHADTIATLHRLALSYSRILQPNQTPEAIRLLELVRDHRVALLGPDDELTLATLDDLAAAYRDVGRHPEAIRLFEQLRDRRIEQFGAADPRSTLAIGKLATALLAARKFGDAVPLFEQVRDAQFEQLGQSDNVVLTTLSSLGTAYSGIGRHADAIRVHKQVRDLRVVQNGPDDFATQMASSTLASTYYNAEMHVEAIPLYEQIRDWYSAEKSPDSAYKINALSRLAFSYLQMGRLSESLETYENIVPRSRVVLGNTHSSTITYAMNWSAALDQAGESVKAAEIMRELLADLRLQPPASDSTLASVLAQFGTSLTKSSQFVEAEAVLTECLTIRERTQPDSWSTFNAKSTLGGAVLGQKKFSDAEPLLLAGYEGMKSREQQISAAGKFRHTEALERLVELYTAWGKADEAAKWRKELDERKSDERKTTAKPAGDAIE